jgi:hypothetical protein
MLAGKASAECVATKEKSAATKPAFRIVLVVMRVSPLWLDNDTEIFIARENWK